MIKNAFLVICLLTLPATTCLGGFGGMCNGFRRGDTNGDGSVDLSDGIATLTYLFAGTGRPGCEDAADANDTGTIDLSDAVYTFQFLFVGGAPPPAPGPWECGDDTRPMDDLNCEDIGACGPQQLSRDLSDFDQFRLTYSPGFGFCPQIGDVFEAAITRQADGDYRLELSTLVIGGPGDPCLFDFIGNVECATIEELTPRDLEDDEVAEMLALFGNLGVYLEPHEICDCIAIDPCRIGNFSWDTTDFSDFICSNRRLAESLDRDITNFLESLRGGPGR